MDKIKSKMLQLDLLLSSEEDIALELDTGEIDFSKLCRTCLRETTDNDLGNASLCIISSNGKLLRVHDMFEETTGLKIHSDDMLPHHLCSACLKLVNTLYTFRTLSKRADEILRGILIKVKEEVEDEFPEEYQQQVVVERVSPADVPWMEEEMIEVEQLDELVSEQDEEYLLSEQEDGNQKQPSDSENRFACQFCTRVFALQRDIIQHFKEDHPKEKPFKCGECFALFSHIQSMRRHKKKHQASCKEKMCPLCSRLFQRSDDLKRHIRTHTLERPYSCSKCLKAFKQHTELNDHMLSHTEHKMYKCGPCGKEWRSRNGWYLHMKSHQDGHARKRKTKKKPIAEKDGNTPSAVVGGTLC